MANIKRLEHLIEVLERAKKFDGVKRRFSMGVWGEYIKDDEGVRCGTAACALGWAGLDRKFRREGLVTDVDDNHVGRSWQDPLTNSAEFFAIGTDDASYLFLDYDSRESVTPDQVIARVREVIAARSTACPEQETI